MRTSDKQKIAAELQAKVQRTNSSFNTAAKQMGVSPALLSNINNGKWEQISDDMWRTVAQWAGMNLSEWRTRETANLTTIVNACDDAKENHRLMTVADRTGLGKTTALKWVRDNRPNTYYMLCDVTMTRKDFLAELQRAIGIDQEGSIHARTKSIINALRVMENPLLLLDDVGKLNDQCVRLIQVIYDALEFRAGIVLSGTEHFRTRVFKNASRDVAGYRELKRRVAYWITLKGISMQWLKVVCADYGIEDAQAVQLIKKMCEDYGTLRELMANYERAPKDGRELIEILSSLHIGASEFKHAA